MKKIKVGITGQSGFIGSHLYNHFGLENDIERIEFKEIFFEDQELLKNFVKNCDAIVHLAAINRDDDLKHLYNTNLKLVQNLISACKTTNSTPHLIFSSSTQEARDNPYGRSKFKGRELFENWARENNANFTGLIIPNVFGAFGRPNYNSVIATFCYKLTHNEIPVVYSDGKIELIYVHKLAEEIIKEIKDQYRSKKKRIYRYLVPYQYRIKVSKVLLILNEFNKLYLKKGIFPDISNNFKKDLFNTFRTYIDDDHFPFQYLKNEDQRGIFVEIARTNSSGQFSFSTTVPGITRGNHYHTRKAERFAVIKGKARIQLRKIGTEKIINYELDGENPSFVDMPIWSTHNITNIGNEELVTLFWINEPYNIEDSDTYFENV